MFAVIGDVHGHIEKLQSVLTAESLIDNAGKWSAGSTELWFMGDYFDRGPDGVGVVDLIMRLQTEAAAAGGNVGAILGNHDAHLLAAYGFGDCPDGSRSGTFLSSWHANGGSDHDLHRLRPEHIAWIKTLPAMAIVEDRLLAHADATFYVNYGTSTTSVNDAIAAVLQSDATAEWESMLDYFSQRRAFVDRFLGMKRAARFLDTYGGEQFVHAHTPIANLTGEAPGAVHEAYVYAGGSCIDVDPGLYLGGPGFITYLGGV